MGRIFAFCSAAAVLMILLAGGGVYWLSMAEMQKTRQDATATVARGAALGITAQTALLTTSINKIVRDPAVIAVVAGGDPKKMKKTAVKIENYLPDVLKVRLFLPGKISPDDNVVPHLGFADIELVQKTFKNNQKPVIQGKTGPNRHMAIARRIVKDGQAIGVLLVSLDYQFLTKTIRNAGIENDYMELQQDRLVMGSIGNSEIKKNGKKGEFKIIGTNWIIRFWTPASVSLGDITLFFSTIIIPALLACLAFFIGYRRYAEIFRLDQSSIQELIKDLMSGQMQGSYPVVLNEMRAIVATAIQLKRVLEGGEYSMDIEKEGDLGGDRLGHDSFFSELDVDEGLSIDQIFAETTEGKTGGEEASNLSTGIEVSEDKL